jgi:pimeloyl-ACP methyl ester carboxylesterase
MAADFAEQGLVQAVRDAGLAVDMVAVDARLGHYFGGQVTTMLGRDVMRPARAKGYRNVWLAGISLGGLGALLYTEEHPQEVAGVIVLAPYLGDPPLIDEIRGSGGVRQWEPGLVDQADYQRRLWAWLKEVVATPEQFPPIFLGFGRQDRFADAHELLAEILPRDRVFATDGGHEWATWRPLWGAILAHADLPRRHHGRWEGRP